MRFIVRGYVDRARAPDNPHGPTTILHAGIGIPEGLLRRLAVIVEETGRGVRSIKKGQFVIGSFFASDNTCPHCLAGMTSVCDHQGWTESGQAELVRVNQADGSLVATDGMPDDAMLPSLLTLSDVMATGWHAAVSSRVQPGGTAVVIGDGAVGLCGVIAAKELGAERIVAMSRHEPRQALAREFGATHIVAERGKEGAARVEEIAPLGHGLTRA